MKFWLATMGFNYEGGYVLGVFSTKELAEARLVEYKANGSISGDWENVEELTLDSATDISI